MCLGLLLACFLNFGRFLDLRLLLVHDVGACDEEIAAIFSLLGWLCEFIMSLLEPHLLMVRWREHVFLLGFLGQLARKDLTLNVCARSDVADWISNTLSHHFCIQVVSFDLFSGVPGHEFDRIRVRQMLLLGLTALENTGFVDQMGVVDDYC